MGSRNARHPCRTNRLPTAKLRFLDASIQDLDSASAAADLRYSVQLAQSGYVKAHESLIQTRQISTGKTWLACAFGRHRPVSTILSH